MSDGDSRAPAPAHVKLLSRLIRLLPDLRRVRGGLPGALQLVGPARFPLSDMVAAESEGIKFQLNRSSLLEWIVFHFGDYEGQEIQLFLNATRGRRGVVLDIGANIGNHALRFAKHFERVHAFEPNPDIYKRLVSNIKANPDLDVCPHNIGLGSSAGVLPFYAPAENVRGGNMGAGTFVASFAPETADVLSLRIEAGDEALAEAEVESVDAIKIDVQGFEPDVMKGLRKTIARCKPAIWFEASPDTIRSVDGSGGLKALVPYDFELRIFGTRTTLGLFHKIHLTLVDPSSDLLPADYLILPRESDGPAAA